MRNWTISGDGGTPRTGAHFIRMIRFVNGAAEGKDQEPVFGQPETRHDGPHYWEIYPRCSIRMTKLDDPEEYKNNDRKISGITFFVEDDDVELQGWLEAAKAHTMGVNVGKSFSQGDSIERLGDEPFGQGDSIRRLN